MIFDLALENGVICDGTELFPANVYVRDEIIELIAEKNRKFQARQSVDCSGLFLLPGFIDPHVHFELNLGKYSSRDDFDSGSALALSGGVTSIIDFLDPVSSAEELQRALESRLALAAKSRVDYSFHVTLAGNPESCASEIIDKSLSVGLPSIKVFTTYSSSGRRTKDGMLFDLLSLSRSRGVVILAHAENDELIVSRSTRCNEERPFSYVDLPYMRPTISEVAEVAKLVLFSNSVHGQLYIVHVSSGETVRTISSMDIDWKKSTVLETCPQYLLLDASMLEKSQGFLNTYCPPPREDVERRILNEELKKGNLQTIGTDHCPFLSTEKEENVLDYRTMPNGTGSLGISFSALNTILDGDIVKTSSLLSTNPAKAFGLYPFRGRIAPGSLANLAIVDRDCVKEYSKSPFTKSDHTLFEGFSLRGEVKTTVLRGRVVFHENRVLADPGNGRVITRGPVFWRD